MTNPNPLDRIRALAPADMTDDELGVAVWDARYGAAVVANFDLNNPKVSIESAGRHIGSVWKHNGTICCVRSTNPALSYDALLQIVREWCGESASRFVAILSAAAPITERAGIQARADEIANSDDKWGWTFLDGETFRDIWLFFQLDPRQIAEAFVTAAREVEG